VRSWATSLVWPIATFNWGLLARDLKDYSTEKEKLEAALSIFTELKMPMERDAVEAELSKDEAVAQDEVTKSRAKPHNA